MSEIETLPIKKVYAFGIVLFFVGALLGAFLGASLAVENVRNEIEEKDLVLCARAEINQDSGFYDATRDYYVNQTIWS